MSIVGRKCEPGVYLSEVVKGGTADCDGRLMQGDQILAINGDDVTNALQEQVAAILKTCTGKVHLKVGRWKLTASEKAERRAAASASKSKSPSGGAATPSITDQEVSAADSSTTTAGDTAAKGSVSPAMTTTSVQSPTPSGSGGARPAMPVEVNVTTKSTPSASVSPKTSTTDVVAPPAAPVITPAAVSLTDTSAIEKKMSVSATSQRSAEEIVRAGPVANEIKMIRDLYEEGSDSLLIELNKVPQQTLGMGIGKRARGILVTSLLEGSAAASANLRVGDRLMAVNGKPVTDQASAVEYVKASGERLVLQVARPRSLNGDEMK